MPASRRSRWTLLALLLAVAALALWLSRARAPRPPRLNLLLISIDSVPRDGFGLYGRVSPFAPELPVTPYLDRLAHDAAVFDEAWSNTSWTLPAHLSFFTGLADGGHGVLDDEQALDPRRTTLAEAFAAAGAETAGVYSGPYLDPRYGCGQGFARYESAMMPRERLRDEIRRWAAEQRAAGLPVDEAMLEAIRRRISHYDVTSPRVVERAREFLDRRDPARPFFLFLHFFDAHSDYLPELAEPGLGRRFDPDYEGTASGVDWHGDPAVREIDPRTGGTRARRISERDLAHVRALADAELHWVDRHIGLVLAELEARGLDQNTLVCVVTDHGDEFFEHGSIGHRSTLFPELTRIALLLRLPDGTAAGARLPQLVRSYDLAPTLLDLAGLPPLAEADGRSLRPLLEHRPEPARELVQRLAAASHYLEAWRDERFAIHRVLVESEPGAAAVASPLEPARNAVGEPLSYLFDRRLDPGEQRPLDPRDPRWPEALAAYRRSFDALAERHARLRGAAPPAGPAREPEQRAALGELGYLDGDEPAAPPAVVPAVVWPPPAPARAPG